MGKTGLTNCFGGWVLKPISFRNWPLELSITLAAKCCIARCQVADIHEKRSIGNFGLRAADLCDMREGLLRGSCVAATAGWSYVRLGPKAVLPSKSVKVWAFFRGEP